MKSYIKFLFAVLMVLGMSMNAWGYNITVYTSNSKPETVTLNKTTANSGETITISISPQTNCYCPNSVEVVSEYIWYGIYYIDEEYDEDYTKVNNGVGNKTFSFTMPAYNVILYVDYKGASAHSVTYNVPSCVTSIGTKSDSQFRLPSASSDLSAYIFAGWTTSSSYSSTTAPSVLYKAGEAIPDNVSTVYAVYSSISSAFSKTSTLTNGNDYMFFISDNSSASAADRLAINNAVNTSKHRLEGTSYSVKSSATTCTDWGCIWTFEQGTGSYSSYWFIYNKQLGKYIGVTGTGDPDSNDRCMQLSDDKDDFTAWTASASSGQITLTSKKRSSCTNKRLVVSGDYAGIFNTSSNLYLYGQGAATITYTTSPSCPATSFTVTYAGGGADGGTLPTDANEYETGDWVDVAANTLTKTGYEFAGWLSSYNGNTYDAEDLEHNGFYMGDENITLTAQWTAATTTITLNKNCTTGTNGSATVIYNATALATKSHATNSATGYHIEGYYTNDATPVKILNSDWSFANTNISGYVASGKWTYTTASTLTLYAHWELNTHSLHWYKNDEGADALTGSYTDGDAIAYGTSITAPNTPTFTGHTFEGWSTTSSGSITTPATSMPDADVAYYAIWSLNSHKLSVAGSIANITVTATPAGGAAIAEGGNNASVNYGTSVTLSGTGITSGYALKGWKVTKDADGSDVTASVVAGNTLTMPDYDVTVNAELFAKAKMKTRCPTEVEFEVSGDKVWLTSYAGVEVFTDSVANQITVTCDNWGSANRLYVSYLDDEGTEKTGSDRLFRICDASTFTYMDASNNYFAVSGTTHASGVKYAISYKPGASEYNQTDTWTLRLTAACGTTPLGHQDITIHGRALPQKFVIAAKIGGLWKALPADLATSSGSAAKAPYIISVDDSDAPTEAYYAPKAALYSAANRPAPTTHRGGIRLHTETEDGSDGYLQAARSNGSTSIWRTTSGCSTGMQSWYLRSTSFGDYKINVDPAIYVSSGSGEGDDSEGNTGTLLDRKLSVYDGKIGWYKTSADNFRILPVTNEIEDVREATVHEWGEHGVVLNADMTGVASVTVNVDGGSPSAATLTPVNAASLTAGKYVKVDAGELTIGAIANENKVLYLHWKNAEGTEIDISEIVIPRVIASSRDMYVSPGGTAKTPWNTEVHVLPGVTLTANTASFTPSGATIKELHIYPGATLNVSTGTLTATTLRLHNGWTRAGDKEYDVARVYIADDAALAKDTAWMDYDIYEKSDGKHYYPLAVPFKTKVSKIDYADTTLAKASIYGKHIGIDKYDGANRAKFGVVDTNWVQMTESEYLEPGKGYTITAVSSKGSAIIRVPVESANTWTADGEKATIDDKYFKNKVDVVAYTGAATSGGTANTRHAGWNLLGVPYMSCFASKNNATHDEDDAFITGKMSLTGDSSDPYGGYDDDVVYVTVPTHDFSEYLQYDITDNDTKLLPGWCFFIQFAKSGTLTFAVAGQQENSSLPIYAPKRDEMPVVKTGIILSGAEASDKTTLLISDKYSAEYEIGADLEKMFGNGYTLATYSLSRDTRLAYNAMSTEDAKKVIPIGFRAPEDGEYTFSLNPRYAEAAVERVDLIDYQTGEVTNLMMSDYTFKTGRTQDDERFALNVVPMAKVPTGNEQSAISGQQSDVRKIILDDKMYIIYDGLMYDATGKRVTEINK